VSASASVSVSVSVSVRAYNVLGPACDFTIKPVLALTGMAPVDGYEIPDRHREAVHPRIPARRVPLRVQHHPTSTGRPHHPGTRPVANTGSGTGLPDLTIDVAPLTPGADLCYQRSHVA
jgi:hypothetical protein